MWFKNLCLFRLTEPFVLSPDELAEKLQPSEFRPCGGHDPVSMGWVSPLAASGSLVYAANGRLMLCLKKQERVLPDSVVNEILAEKADVFESEQGRAMSKKERGRAKDEIIFDLLPKAFTYSRKLYAYIDAPSGWLIVDSASSKSAEDLLSLLRKSLGSLPAVPVSTANNPVKVMTQWLAGQDVPNDMVVADECELRAMGDDAGVIRCKRHDLKAPEIQNHLDSGKEAVKLALNWDERLSFVMDHQFYLKRLKFLDLVQNQLKDMDIEDEASRFDADFAIMTEELGHFLPRLLELFGGEPERN